MKHDDNNSKKKYHTIVKVLLLITAVIIGILILPIIESESFKIEIFIKKENVVYIVTLMTLIIVYAALLGTSLYSNIKRDREKVESFYNNLRKFILPHTNPLNNQSDERDINNKDIDNRDIIELMIANMKEINEYYVLSKRMTQQSFILAVCMCIGGFMIISVSVAFILINNFEAKEAIIPIISGAVVEAIAATTLIVYKKSIEQLNRYYDALHNNEIFLSSVNLVSKISTEKRDQMYEYIIKTKLENKSNQNNTEGQ